ncbi:hypothetical protein GEMRC1_011889 [Eukaryota sp. GEM-RC1]
MYFQSSVDESSILEGDCQSDLCPVTSYCSDGRLFPIPAGHYSPDNSCLLFPCTSAPSDTLYTGPSTTGTDDCPFLCTKKGFFRYGRRCLATPSGWSTAPYSDDLFPCEKTVQGAVVFDSECNAICERIDEYLDDILNICTDVGVGFYSPPADNGKYKCVSSSDYGTEFAFIPITRGGGVNNCQFSLNYVMSMNIEKESFRIDFELFAGMITDNRRLLSVNDQLFLSFKSTDPDLFVITVDGIFEKESLPVHRSLLKSTFVLSLLRNQDELYVAVDDLIVSELQIPSTIESILKFVPVDYFSFIQLLNLKILDFSLHFNHPFTNKISFPALFSDCNHDSKYSLCAGQCISDLIDDVIVELNSGPPLIHCQ